MPTDDMWKWLINPLVGAKPPSNVPTTLRMRKDSDSTPGGNSTSGPNSGGSSPGGSPAGRRPQPGLPTPDDPNKVKDPIPPGTNSDKDERDKREKQQDDAKKPNADRMQDAAKDLVKKFADDYLGSLKDQALSDLGKAWKETRGGVITITAALGAAAVTYLVKTGISPGKLPAIPLDRLAKRAPIFKDAELNIEVKGPVTGPESFTVTVTFKEQPAGKSTPKTASGGKPATLKLNLTQGDAKAAKPDVGTDVDIEGEVILDPKVKAEDAAATVKAIRNAKVEVDIGGTPTYRVQVVSVEDNYQGGDYSVNPPPAHRAIKVQLRTSIPPMIRPGKPVIVDATVTVRLNGIRNDGEAKIKVQYQAPPAKDGGKPPDADPTGFEALDRLNKVLPTK